MCTNSNNVKCPTGQKIIETMKNIEIGEFIVNLYKLTYLNLLAVNADEEQH